MNATRFDALAAIPSIHLARQEAYILSTAVGLAIYVVFKRYEPVHVHHHFWLLLAPPLLLFTLVLHQHFPLSPIRGVLVACAMHWGTIIAAMLLYRASPWHPLARYPGPFVYRLSKLALAWTTSDGKQWLHVNALHDRYGDIVRIGAFTSLADRPNEVSLRNASAIVPVLGPNGLPKGPHWAGRNMTDSAQQLVSLVDVREHARRRRPWARAFSGPALRGYEEIMRRRVRQLVELLARHAAEDRVADVGKCVGSFTYDFMSDMAFGGGSEQMRDGDKDSIWAIMEQGLAVSQVMGHCPWLGIYLGYVPMAAALMKALLDYGEERALIRINSGSLSKDLFHYLNNEDGMEKSQPPLAQVAIDGALAIVAGSDTTSCVMTNIFFLLLTHPDVYARLQAEVDAAFPRGEDAMDAAKHADMPYLNAVINETMRLFPPLPSGSQRATTRETGGCMAGEHYIPPETTVNVSFYAMHVDPRNFAPRPAEFWPERWLVAAGQASPPSAEEAEEEGGGKFVHNAAAFLPFSYGPANCVGKALGMQELRAVLALVLQRLRLRPAEGWDGPDAYRARMREWLIVTKPPLPVRVEVRPGKF
ncbi:high nitrogen upregulated cytochrome P450 monooxygenase 2 [Epithele typhae]|uniref:high nitrogen upregulated cytochrome P450 monooxygenase 2 n=1 Tax=Epithele typhae TaxID=378194 RepID=UPI0020073627|nr:high nitrogen upregulated cytochrome P450 monooxygenase 2 [Epithele typhae]KAH9922831.1 high nitrogen upregulated cytochrome P450 monooxygenase 2 [Epithele typhae]